MSPSDLIKKIEGTVTTPEKRKKLLQKAFILDEFGNFDKRFFRNSK